MRRQAEGEGARSGQVVVVPPSISGSERLSAATSWHARCVCCSVFWRREKRGRERRKSGKVYYMYMCMYDRSILFSAKDTLLYFFSKVD